MHKLTDIHSHKVHPGEVRTIYNIRVNDQSLSLPHGPNIFLSAGIHPWDAGNVRSAWMENMGILLRAEQLVAIGECGLDKNVDVSIEQQLEVFEAHIKLSELHKKPIIIHCVGYFNELLALRKTVDPKQPWIIHGFRGKPKLADQLLKAGLYLSFGALFNPESVMKTPIERILVETDESETHIQDIYENIAALKHCQIEDLTAVERIFSFEASSL